MAFIVFLVLVVYFVLNKQQNEGTDLFDTIMYVIAAAIFLYLLFISYA